MPSMQQSKSSPSAQDPTKPQTDVVAANEKLAVSIQAARLGAYEDLSYFLKYVFSLSFYTGTFVGGDYIEDVAKHLQESHYTMNVTGRDHFKSTRLYADIMWAIFTDQGKGFEAHYFSYTQDLAAYHTKKIKGMIKDNPFFLGVIDNKPTSESILDYNWPNGRHMTVTPQGLLAFKRGIHAERIYVDDPFRSEDAENTLDSTQINKINGIVTGELLPMVKKDGYCRIVGTPQTPNDFFFDVDGMQKIFATWIMPAITDEPNKKALWPEWKSFDELIRIRGTMSLMRFNREYMAMPASSANSYIDRDRLMLCATLEKSWDFHSWQTELQNKIVVAGFDIGRYVHPSHLAVYLKEMRRAPGQDAYEPHYIQIFQKWMEGWDYPRQVAYLSDLCAFFNIHVLYYDDTRSEFQGLKDQGKMHRVMEGVKMNANNQDKMGSNFATLVEQSKVELINDPRQLSQILAVHENSAGKFVAVAGPDGHGDSFWSNALALYEERKAQPRIRSLYD